MKGLIFPLGIDRGGIPSEAEESRDARLFRLGTGGNPAPAPMVMLPGLLPTAKLPGDGPVMLPPPVPNAETPGALARANMSIAPMLSRCCWVGVPAPLPPPPPEVLAAATWNGFRSRPEETGEPLCIGEPPPCIGEADCLDRAACSAAEWKGKLPPLPVGCRENELGMLPRPRIWLPSEKDPESIPEGWDEKVVCPGERGKMAMEKR